MKYFNLQLPTIPDSIEPTNDNLVGLFFYEIKVEVFLKTSRSGDISLDEIHLDGEIIISPIYTMFINAWIEKLIEIHRNKILTTSYREDYEF